MPEAGIAIMQEIDKMLDFFLYEKGKSINIKGIDQRALLTDAVGKLTYYDDKIIRCMCQITTGDIVDYNNSKYLIVSQVDKSDISYRAKIRKCNARIAFNWAGTIKWFDCIEESNVFDITSDKYMSLPMGSITVVVQNNADTMNIVLDQRFYVTNQPFKITGIDKSQVGLIKFNCVLDLISTSNDDVDNNIADRWKYEIDHTYTLTIDNADTANILINSIIQLNCTVNDNNNAVQNSAITYASDNPDYISVDNTGKVMGVSLGQAIITAKLIDHEDVQDDITITVVEILNHQYTINIVGDSNIKTGQSKSYASHIYDNGLEVDDKQITWTMRNQDNSTPVMASITSSTEADATIKAVSPSGNVGKYIILKATLVEDNTVFNEHTIRITGLW